MQSCRRLWGAGALNCCTAVEFGRARGRYNADNAKAKAKDKAKANPNYPYEVPTTCAVGKFGNAEYTSNVGLSMGEKL